MARSKDKGKRRARDEEDESAAEQEVEADYEEEETSTTRKKKSGGRKSKSGSAKGKKQKGKNDKQAVAGGSDDEDSEAGAVDSDDAAASKKKGKAAPLTDQDMKRLAYEMARHAIICELNKKLIKREDVAKTFMAGRIRHFEVVVMYASRHLSRSFGLEIVQMRPKEAANTKNPVKTYFVRSRLPAQVLRGASLEQFGDLRSENDGNAPRTELWGQADNFKADGENPGSLRDWRYEEGSSYAILGVILSIILVNGKALPDDQLVSHMKKLHIFPESRINSSIATYAPQPPNFRQFLATMIRQGYLERNVISNGGTGAATQAGGATQTQKGRPRQSMSTSNKNVADDIGDPTVEWKWGARAKAEIGEHGIAKFIEAVYAGTSTFGNAAAAAAETEEAAEDGNEEDGDMQVDGEDEQPVGPAKNKKNSQPTPKELRTAIAKSAGSKELLKATQIKAVAN